MHSSSSDAFLGLWKSNTSCAMKAKTHSKAKYKLCTVTVAGLQQKLSCRQPLVSSLRRHGHARTAC